MWLNMRVRFWKVNRLVERLPVPILEWSLPPVMAGLVPAIHAAPLRQTFQGGVGGPAWMAGTSPAMTSRVKREPP